VITGARGGRPLTTTPSIDAQRILGGPSVCGSAYGGHGLE
jgi:hypothetical protein